MSRVVWSLFDGSGIMVLPWAEAGYQCFCFNAESGDHGEYNVRMRHPLITYVDCWIDKDFNPEGQYLDLCHPINKPDIIFGFPPCTMLAGSGEQHERTPEEIQEALENVRIVETLGNRYDVPWMIENPVGKLSTLWRKPDYYFDPYEYGGYLRPEEETFHEKMPRQDGYTKKTCLWVGNGFVMPKKKPVEHIGLFWGWKYLGGKSEKTKQLRSLTPRGFARAVFSDNREVTLTRVPNPIIPETKGVEMSEFTGNIDLGYRNTDVHKTVGFEILGMVPPKYYNTYVVTICFMEGDADGYQYEEVQFTDEAKLKDFVDFCFRCAIAYPHGKGGRSGYQHVEGYARFVGDFDEDDWDEDEPFPNGDEICLDGWPMVEWEWYTSFDWFKVEYYGATGQACSVKVTTEVINDKETGGVSS